MDLRRICSFLKLVSNLFSVFLDFIANNGGTEHFQGLSTTDVCNKILKPATEAEQLSYCEFLKGLSLDSNEVGTAEVFISHAWKYMFLDVVSAIQSHFKDTPDIYIWFDLFSNNQHLAGNLPFEWWTNTFKSAIKDFGRTVMVLSPWKNPIPFTRAWCLFEIYSAVITNSKFEVAMSESEENTFLDEICSDESAFFEKMLSDIDLKNSEAWNPDDLARIKEVVDKEVGFGNLNYMVYEKMREWVNSTLKSSITVPGLSEEILLRRKMGYAKNLKDTGFDRKARVLYKECLNDYISLRGTENDIDVARVYFRLGQIPKTKLNRAFEALAYLVCYFLLLSLLTFWNYIPIIAYRWLGLLVISVLPNLCGFYFTFFPALGIEGIQGTKVFCENDFHKRALTIRKNKLGENHLDVASSYHGLAGCFETRKFNLGYLFLILHFPRNSSEVIALHKKGLDIRKAQLGEDHTSVAESYTYMAEAQTEQIKKLQFYEKAKKIQIKLGAEHPVVGDLYMRIGNALKSSSGDFNWYFSFNFRRRRVSRVFPISLGIQTTISEIFEKAYNIKVAKFGSNHPSVMYHGFQLSFQLSFCYVKQGQIRKAMNVSLWWWLPLCLKYLVVPLYLVTMVAYCIMGFFIVFRLSHFFMSSLWLSWLLFHIFLRVQFVFMCFLCSYWAASLLLKEFIFLYWYFIRKDINARISKKVLGLGTVMYLAYLIYLFSETKLPTTVFG